MRAFGLGRKKDGPSFARTYLDLRSMVLTIDPASLGITPTPELPDVWGIVVDWGTDSGVATFVALADGTGSMYTSGGSGTIGGQGQRPIVDAGRRLLLAAEAVQGGLLPASEFGPPELARVRYWVLTHGGARTASHGSDGPPAGDTVLGRLGEAFQDYVTAFRLLDEPSRSDR